MRSLGKKLLTLYILILTICLSIDCVRTSGNMPPVLLDVVEDISIHVGDSITLSLEHVTGYDEDADELSLHLHDGDSFSLIGTTLIPDSGFIGDISVLVQLFDGNDFSNIDTMIISVVNKITVMPFYDGSWWNYSDSVFNSNIDTVLISRLEVGDSTVNFNIDSITTKEAHILTWSNLSEYDINYLVGNEDDGLYQYGIATPHDTVIKPQLQQQYPCTLNSSWPFTLIKYNITDSLLFEDTTVLMTCTDTSVYVTVPAGTFHCIEYTFLYDLVDERFNNSDFTLSVMGRKKRSRGGVITEKLYYADGVGYVQNVTYNGNRKIWKKVLTDYYVEERENLE